MKKDKNTSLIELNRNFSDAEIKQCLDKVISSKEFSPKEKTSRLLRFLVNETLAGRNDALKQYTIGTAVFKRAKNFNPDLDPVVRIQAGRLRRSLDSYYAQEGKEDSIRITIPTGSYVPFFLAEHPDVSGKLSGEDSTTKSAEFRNPVIAVFPFKNLTGDRAQDYFVQGFTEELTIELTRYEDFQVISSGEPPDRPDLKDIHETAKNSGSHFALQGSIRKDEQQIKVSIKVLDAITGDHIWGEQYRRDLTSENLINIQEQIVREVISQISGEYGLISKKISQVSRRKPIKDLETYDAVFRFYCFQTNFTPETYSAAFSALEEALKRDPDCGLASAMLGELYGLTFSLDLPGSTQALNTTSKLIQRALTIDPDNQLVRVISAVHYFRLNKRDLFILEMEKALKLNPNSPLRLGGTGFYLALYGKWEEGKQLLDKVMKNTINYPSWFHGATTLYYYRQKKYDLAFREAGQYTVPGLFWGPMLRTACIGQLQLHEEVKQQISELLEMKPDFSEKARMLIKRYVKEDSLVDHLIEGLKKAGLEVA